MSLTEIKKELRALADPKIAAHSARFFKTGPGEYGEGDVFLGIRVPELRRLVKQYPNLPLEDIGKLLSSPRHEERLLALLLLVRRFAGGDDATRRSVYNLYMKSRRFINNWDLVDASAPGVVGAYLQDKDRSILRKLARSPDLWTRRIAMLATFHFIKHGEFDDALELAGMLLSDEHDLMHKAVGWMLREIGKRDGTLLRRFLQSRYKKMPRTMLRYAIEKFPEKERKNYLAGNI